MSKASTNAVQSFSINDTNEIHSALFRVKHAVRRRNIFLEAHIMIQDTLSSSSSRNTEKVPKVSRLLGLTSAYGLY